MKKIFFTPLVFLLFISINAQQVTNGSLNGNCSGNGFVAPSCIKGWSASHGTPTVLKNTNNNTWALLSANSETSEGIYTNYNFIAGKTYHISFKMKTYINANYSERRKAKAKANIRTTNELTASSIANTKEALKTSELVWTSSVSNKISNWETIHITYTPTKNNAQLWFFPSMKANSKFNKNIKAQMEIDDIEINTSENSSFNTTIEIEDNQEENITENIFPNPIYRGQLLNISANPKNVNEVALFSLTGEKQRINFDKLDSETISFNINNTISKGIYVLNIVKNDNSTITQKIIIE
ncbi:MULTISPECIES: T9SS type A sorting domain-containing protein [Flavobacterium]|uniref:T9SS type A sorting domain-containing protein n=1 Tax=Flavobacterium jumunjinense TaxID=998845 RepID=A0ABV5GS72_9FLAO|nr:MULTISPECIES: T9SS type A sorting domain-containing protein [Flavobacterium]